MRDTSLLSYTELKPKLPTLEDTVYKLVLENPDCTDKELGAIATYMTEANIRCRRIELTHKGKIESSGKRKCTITNKLAMTWHAKPHMENKKT